MAEKKPASKKNNSRTRKNDIKTASVAAVKGGRKTAQNADARKLAAGREATATGKKAAAATVTTADRTRTQRPGAKKRRFVKTPPAKGPVDTAKAAETQAKGAAKVATFGKLAENQETKETLAAKRRSGSVRAAGKNLREKRRDVRAAENALAEAQKAPRHADVLKELKSDLLDIVNSRHRPAPANGKPSTKHPSDAEVEGYKTDLKNRIPKASTKSSEGGGISERDSLQFRLERLTKAHDAVKKHLAIGADKYDANIEKSISEAKNSIATTQKAAKDAEDIRGNADRIDAETVDRDRKVERGLRQAKRARAVFERKPETKILRFSEADITDHRGNKVPRWKFLKFPSVSAMVRDRKEGEAHQDFMARHTSSINTKIQGLKDRAAKRGTPNRGTRPTMRGLGPNGEVIEKPLRDASNNPVKVTKKTGNSAERLRKKMAERNAAATPAAPAGEVKSKQIADALEALGKTEKPF